MKELIYIVTWCLVTIVPQTTLMNPADKYDEFGREVYNPISLVKHYDCNHVKTFDNLDSAMLFYNNALNEGSNFYDMGQIKIERVNIDSMDADLYDMLRQIRSEQSDLFHLNN